MCTRITLMISLSRQSGKKKGKKKTSTCARNIRPDFPALFISPIIFVLRSNLTSSTRLRKLLAEKLQPHHLGSKSRWGVSNVCSEGRQSNWNSAEREKLWIWRRRKEISSSVCRVSVAMRVLTVFVPCSREWLEADRIRCSAAPSCPSYLRIRFPEDTKFCFCFEICRSNF